MESRCEHTVKVSRKEQAECRLEGLSVLGVPQATSRWMTHEGDSQESGHGGALGCAVLHVSQQREEGPGVTPRRDPA